MTAVCVAPTPIRSATGWTLFLVGLAPLLAVLMGLAELDATGRIGLVILAGTVVTGLAVELLVFQVPPREALRLLGFGATPGRVLVLALAVAALIQSVYPLTTALTGAELHLRADWPWLLLGIFTFHGLAEELVWRGYAYRRLRVGRSFTAAVLLTMPLLAATHLPIYVTSGPVVGTAALTVAAATSIPLARLFDLGRSTIWAPAIVHTAIDSFKLVVVPVSAQLTFSLLLSAISIAVPLLVLLPRLSRVPSNTVEHPS